MVAQFSSTPGSGQPRRSGVARPKPGGTHRRLLENCHVLVVEDEYLLAAELVSAMADHGARLLGPCASESVALEMLQTATRVDGAVVDVNLRGVQAFGLADALLVRHIPFIFTTGYERAVLPRRFHQVPRCVKPLRASAVAHALNREIAKAN